MYVVYVFSVSLGLPIFIYKKIYIFYFIFYVII